MKRTVLLWIIAFVITIASAVYQRMTGPTYPLKITTTLDERELSFSLDRTHGGEGNHVVTIFTNDEKISGILEWKRLGIDEPFTKETMNYNNGKLTAELPHQPPAGKLEYQVTLTDGSSSVTNGTIIRFKGEVPAAILLVHILCMFTGMLFATRAGLEIFNPQPQYKKFTNITFALLTIGGMILGPVVLYYAFGDIWTGWPVGTDITDNKTLIAFIVWLTAMAAVRKSKNPKVWILSAAVVTLIVFLIPHSLWGTELNYQTMQRQ
ncbi:MAG: hypothetical protein H3C35_02970 [Bacteroidetes bacterium]|nr:hypothetical protein [Bacteroidota bacterium]